MSDSIIEKADHIWGPKGGTDFRAMVRVRSMDGDTVLGHPLFGGFEFKKDKAAFLAGYEVQTEDRLRELSGSFSELDAQMDSFPDGVSMKGWTNGHLWNGWEVPFFTRDVVEAAISDGLIQSNRWNEIRFVEEIGTFAEISPVDSSHELPADLDRRALVDAALAEGGSAEVEVSKDILVGIDLAPVRTIETSEGPLTVYGIGNGWCWYPAVEPETSPAP